MRITDLPLKNGLPYNDKIIKAYCHYAPMAQNGLEGYEFGCSYLAISLPKSRFIISNLPWNDAYQSFPEQDLIELIDIAIMDRNVISKVIFNRYFKKVIFI